MTPDELRALADALEPMAKAPRFADFDVPGFCAWVRACADAQPVAWMHIDGRVISAATMDQAYRDGGAMQSSLRDYTIPLYAHPAPAAPQAMEDANVWKQIVPDDEPQAEPKREPLSDDDINKLAWKQNLWTDHMIEFSFLAFAREVERAHGIGGSDEC